jgi:uncharacterized protein
MLAVGSYPLIEAKWCRVSRHTVSVPRLPAAFSGTTLALLGDVHHGPFVPLGYVEHVVALAQSLEPDLVCFVGDYVHNGARYIDPCWDVLSGLRAKLGRFAVLGNHDHWDGAEATRRALQRSAVPELRNRGEWVRRGGARLRVAGLGDIMEDEQDLGAALGDATLDDPVLLLVHEPDAVESIRDPRVGLVLSGHTHGGQIVIPGYGAPVIPSRYGQKYAEGLVRGPTTRVFVTRGVGTISPPVRLFCRPEIALLTLVAD